MPFIIYAVTHVSTGEVKYIGATTTSLAQRWRGHKKHARRDTRNHSPLHDAMRSYGFDAFAISHVASAWDEASLSDLEAILIAQCGTLYPAGYNLLTGGQVGFAATEEARRRMRGPRRSWTIEERQRYRDIQLALGKKMPPDAIARTRAAHVGKIVSEETRRRMSEAATRRVERELAAGTRVVPGPEARQALSKLRKGVPRPPDVIQKMKDTKRARRGQ